MNEIELPELPLPQRDVNVNEILRCVAHSYTVAIGDLLGRERFKNIAEARLVSYWLLRTRTQLSYPEIGRALRRDHTTVMAGLRTVIRRRAKEEGFCAFTNQLAEAVEARVKGGVAA